VTDQQAALISIEEMKRELCKATKAYCEARKTHIEDRHNNIKKMEPKTRKVLLRLEAQRHLARIGKGISGKLISKSVTRMEHLGVEHTTQESIEEALFPVNKAKVRASKNTSFMQMLLLGDFEYRRDKIAHEQVLPGTYETPIQLIKGPKRAQPTPPKVQDFNPRTHITTDDHIKGWKRQKERTSGGLSGIHFGHFKAHIKRQNLAEIYASMQSLPYTTGYSVLGA
jgi:hypothetical protein